MRTPRVQQFLFACLAAAFVTGLTLLAALVPVGVTYHTAHNPPLAAGQFGATFTRFPLQVAVPWAVCFLAGLIDWRRPWRVEHLDLLALAGLFPSTILFTDGYLHAGMLLGALCLTWLFTRLAGVWWGTFPFPDLHPSVSARKLGAVIVAVLAVRLLVALGSGGYLDVGPASALGAFRLLHGLHLYGGGAWWHAAGVNVYRANSYGPFAYYAYMPFVLAFGLPPRLLPTLAPALCFDLLTIAGLDRLGRKLGGQTLGHSYVFAYLLFPFAALALFSQTNDALIAALLVWTLVFLHRPLVRAVLLACAALTKFLPGLLCLAFMGPRLGRWRYAAALACTLAGLMAYPLIDGGPAAFWHSTFAYQNARGLTFSVWGALPVTVAVCARALLAAVLLALASSPLWKPRPVTVRAYAALAGALLIGAQLCLGYWSYLYIVWFYPLLVVAFVTAPGMTSDASDPPA